MKYSDKQLFVMGFCAGFRNDSCTFGTDGAYCQGFIEGAKLSGLVSEKKLLKWLTKNSQ